MAKDYSQLVQTIVDNVGGKDNIISMAHCTTRLRFKLKDTSKANTEALEGTPGVIKVMNASGQYQVVVGQAVDNIYDAALALGGIQAGGEVPVDDEGAEKKGVMGTLIDLISGIIQPTLGVLSAAASSRGFSPWPSSSSGRLRTMAPTRSSTASPTASSTSCPSSWATRRPRSSAWTSSLAWA